MKFPSIMQRFNNEQLASLPWILRIAEDLVGDYFKLTTLNSERYIYDIMTLGETEPALGQFDQHFLARIDKFQKLPPPLSPLERLSRIEVFYRIWLNDHTILYSLRSNYHLFLSNMDAVFSLFVLAILTHELVHLIRFASYHEIYEAPLWRRHEEEKKVQAETMEILARYKNPRLAQIYQFFEAKA